MFHLTRRRTLACLLGALAASAVGSGASAHASATFYQDADARAAQLTLQDGASISSLRGQTFNCNSFRCDNWNDKFSSVHAWTSDVTLYEHDGFQGLKYHIGAGGYIANLGWYNDLSSSVKVEPAHRPRLTLSGPAGVIRLPSSTLHFSADPVSEREGARFTCTVDGRSSECSSPLRVDGAGDASHVVDVTLTDPWGHTDSGGLTWRVDAIPPALTLIDGPTSDPGTNNDSPTFRFDIGDAVTVGCSLDDPGEAGFRSCTTSRSQSYQKLGDGLHTFRVRATDGLGNRAELRRDFRIDTIAPKTTIVTGPAEGSRTSDRTADFRFSSEAGTRFECRVDAASFRACPGGEPGGARLTDLPFGVRVFQVRAIDRVGNVEAGPAARSWEVMADLDHDHYSPPQDCDDNNPQIHPGAYEVAGNDADENCDGIVEPFSRMTGDVQAMWRLRGARTELMRLRAVRVPANTTIELRCRGPHKTCPLRVARQMVRKARERVTIAPKLRGRRLPAHTRIEVRLSRPATRGVAVRFVTRKRRAPIRIDRCLPAVSGDVC